MWTIVDSPVGSLRVVAHRDAVTAIEFAAHVGLDAAAPGSSVMTAAAARAIGRPVGDRADDDPLLREAARQLAAYFARDLKEFDLPLRPEGTAFQLRVWDAAAAGRLRRDRVVRRDRPPARHDQRGLAGGRPGQRTQPDPDRDPVPPRGRRQRDAHRLRRRRGAQAAAPRARAGRAVLSGAAGGRPRPPRGLPASA